MFERLQEIVLKNEKFLSEQEEPEVIQLIFAYTVFTVPWKKGYIYTLVNCQLHKFLYQYLLT